jgi:hypothetical protein
MRSRFLSTLILFVTVPVIAQSIATVQLDPATVRPNRTAPVLLSVTTAGDVGALRLDTPGGAKLDLALAAGKWTLSLDGAEIVRNYETADVGRKLVGTLRLFSGGRLTTSYSIFINVLDDTMPRVALGSIDSNSRISPRILNLRMTTDTSADSREVVTKQMYKTLGDDYDFINLVFELPNLPSNRFHSIVRNPTQGIGLGIIDQGVAFGSLSRLIGMNVFPIDTYFDMGEKAASHEIGHQWINYLPFALDVSGPHWPPSSMAHSLMGFSLAGSGAGGDFAWLLEPQGDGTWLFRADPPRDEFSDLDLYLMGFIGPSQVGTQAIVTGGEACAGCPATVRLLGVNEVIAATGARVPTAATAPKSFRIATVVITRDRLLTDDELTLMDYFAFRGEATTILQSNTGLAGRTTVRPFHLATRGIGHLDLSLAIPDFVVFAHSFEPRRLLPNGAKITVHGSGFTTFTNVTVDGRLVTDVAVTSATTLTFTAPSHAAGNVDVVITTPGKGSVRVPGALSYSGRRRAT